MVNNGDIILVKNLVFRSGLGIMHLDHACNTGRPTIIICRTHDFYYGCTLSSTSLCEAKNHYPLSEKKTIYEDNQYKKPSKVNISNFYELKACGYPIVGAIKEKYYRNFLNYILDYYKDGKFLDDDSEQNEIKQFVLQDISKQLRK